MNKERIWNLLSRKLSGEATTDELQELDNLLEAKPAMDLPAQFVQEYWGLSGEADKDFLEATYLLHTDRLKEKGYDLEESNAETDGLNFLEHEPPTGKKKIIRIAAMAVAVVAIFTALFLTKPAAQAESAKAISEVSTKDGSRSKMTLPDGTQVWLNSNTKLIYDNESFAKGVREVTLTGEAYFDVVKNPDRPFIIHAKKINIKVLGTAFNVKAYPGEKTTETSLIRGSVEVTVKDREEKIVMKPNEKLIINNDDVKAPMPVSGRLPIAVKQKAILVKPQPIIELSSLTLYPTDNSIVETGWVENRLVFSGETFENIAVKMERWYGLTIVIKDEKLRNVKITGSFTEETIYQALDALQFTTKFTYRIDRNTITISN